MYYQSKFELGHVALNVKDLALQTAYYQQVLGLEVLAQSDNLVDLGVGEDVLVRLLKTEDDSKVTQSYGLYHLAIVLPSREALGDIFRHFLKNQVPLVGASNHGYSEAIYLEDTEGNGIEIYRDRPESEWDIREDGRIIGITEAMDSQGVYDAGQGLVSPYRMPEGSRMGHVHLSVSSSQASSLFYQKVLEMQDKFSVPSAAWLASGNYHHHLAVNEWGGRGLAKRQPGMKGLAYYTVIYNDALEYDKMLERAQAAQLDLEIHSKQVAFVDVDGIRTQLTLVEK